MALEALLCSSDDSLPQHWSVLRAMHTLNNPKNNICLLRRLLPIHKVHWCGGQGLMRGAGGPFLPAAAMVCYGCVGYCWPLEANVNVRSAYCRNSKYCLQKYFFYSYVEPIHF